jgi:uncharacterized cofD-like protein
MIVSIGGGSGQSTILSSLKKLDYIVAIVAITDDGGSSGKIKEDLNVPPPGDIRNCIIALAEEEPIMNDLMQYRFNKGFLKNHTVGNILIAALTEIYEDFSYAVDVASKILKIKGKVLPAYHEILNLGAIFEDNKTLWGETNIRNYNKKIDKIFLNREVYANSNIIKHIKEADMIIIGPGSLYTSIITNFLVKGVKEAISESKAKVVFIHNIFTEPGETSDFTVSEHLKVLDKYFPINRIDYLLLNNGKPPHEIIKRYSLNKECLVKDDLNKDMPFKIIRDNFISVRNNIVRHSSIKINNWAKKILENKV